MREFEEPTFESGHCDTSDKKDALCVACAIAGISLYERKEEGERAKGLLPTNVADISALWDLVCPAELIPTKEMYKKHCKKRVFSFLCGDVLYCAEDVDKNVNKQEPDWAQPLQISFRSPSVWHIHYSTLVLLKGGGLEPLDEDSFETMLNTFKAIQAHTRHNAKAILKLLDGGSILTAAECAAYANQLPRVDPKTEAAEAAAAAAKVAAEETDDSDDEFEHKKSSEKKTNKREGSASKGEPPAKKPAADRPAPPRPKPAPMPHRQQPPPPPPEPPAVSAAEVFLTAVAAGVAVERASDPAFDWIKESVSACEWAAANSKALPNLVVMAKALAATPQGQVEFPRGGEEALVALYQGKQGAGGGSGGAAAAAGGG